MRCVIQRVREARLDLDGRPFSSIGPGFVVLVGYGAEEMRPENAADRQARHARILDKMLGLRVFPDHEGKMNVDLDSFGGEILVVSQFTLYADCRKGRRPSFSSALPPGEAAPLYAEIVDAVSALLPGKVRSGIFAADMDVALVNWGPVTIILDSDDF